VQRSAIVRCADFLLWLLLTPEAQLQLTMHQISFVIDVGFVTGTRNTALEHHSAVDVRAVSGSWPCC